MSSLHGTIRRYQLIIERVGYGRYPSAQELMDFLSGEGFEISKRTLQRDIEQLRFEFSIELTYDRARDGYYIPEESSGSNEQFLRLAHQSQLMGMISGVGSTKKRIDYLRFQARNNLTGIDYLPALLRAIEKQQVVQIRHTSYYRDEPKQYSVRPYFLKEYKDRWYLVGWAEERKDFRSFGIDRIEALKESNRNFDRGEYDDPSEFFEQIIGITYSLSDLEEVELSFDPFQGNYVKSLPLHDSQVILSDNENELRIRLVLRPNFEFMQLLLGYGDKVKVLKPASLAKEIADIQRKASDQYK